MGSLSIWHLLLLLAVVLLVFGGGGKIPKLMKDMGQGITAFKKGLKDEPKPGEPGRKLANEFRSGMDDLLREAELEETRRVINQAMSEGVEKTLVEHVDPTGEIQGAVA